MKTLIKVSAVLLILFSLTYVGCKDDAVAPKKDLTPEKSRRSATSISYANADNPQNSYGDNALDLLEEFMIEHINDDLIVQDVNDSVYTDTTEGNMESIANSHFGGYAGPATAVYDGFASFQAAVADMSDLNDELVELKTDGLLTNAQINYAEDYFDALGLADTTSLMTVADSLKVLENQISSDADELNNSEKEELLKAAAAARILMSFFFNVDHGFESGESALGFDAIISDITDDTEVALNTVAASAAKVAFIQSIRGQDSNDEDGLFAATVSAIWWIISYDGDRTFALKGWGCPEIEVTQPDKTKVTCCCDVPVKGSKCRPCGTPAPATSSSDTTRTF